MSAFVVNDKTISAIVKGFEYYGGVFRCENYSPKNQVIISQAAKRHEEGQALKDYNVLAVAIRYSEDFKQIPFRFENVEIDEGTVIGCIDCFIYQAEENPEFPTSELFYSLQSLKDKIIERLVKKVGQEIPYGLQ